VLNGQLRAGQAPSVHVLALDEPGDGVESHQNL
jgi:hypothetical protein